MVSDLSRSKDFYEQVLGFVPDAYYEPTRWQSYKFDGRAYFSIAELAGFQRGDSWTLSTSMSRTYKRSGIVFAGRFRSRRSCPRRPGGPRSS